MQVVKAKRNGEHIELEFGYNKAVNEQVKRLGGRFQKDGSRAFWKIPRMTRDRIDRNLVGCTVVWEGDDAPFSISGKMRPKIEERPQISRQIEFKGDLFPFQEHGVEWLLKPKGVIETGGLLGDDVGLGKTIQAISYAIRLREIEQINKVLVICEASAKLQWASEIQAFSTDIPGLIDGTKQQRERQYADASNSFFTVVNFELVFREPDKSIIENTKYDLLIVDEAHKLKNHKGVTHKAVKGLTIPRVVLLTATPLKNANPIEIFAETRLLSDDIFGNFYNFSNNYLVWGTRYGHKEVVDYKNLLDLRDKLNPYFLMRKAADVGQDLPEIVEIEKVVAMTDTQKKIHDEIERILDINASMLEAGIEDKKVEERTRNSMMGKITILQEVADAPEVLLESSNKQIKKYVSGFSEDKISESPKIDMVSEIIDEILEQGDKVLVFTQFQRVADLLLKRLTPVANWHKAGIDSITGERPTECKRITEGAINPDCFTCQYFNSCQSRRKIQNIFQDKNDISVLICTDAAKQSLNLQSAKYIVNVDLPWDPTTYIQRVGRIHRLKSQHSQNFVYNIVAKGSIDGWKSKKHEKKTDRTNIIMGQ